MSGEGLELQRVKRVFSASDVLRCVFPSAALAEKPGGGGGDRGERVFTGRMRVKGKKRSRNGD